MSTMIDETDKSCTTCGEKLVNVKEFTFSSTFYSFKLFRTNDAN